MLCVASCTEILAPYGNEGISQFQSATFRHVLIFCLMVEVSHFSLAKWFSLVEAAKGESPPLTASTPEPFLRKADRVYQALRNFPSFLHCLFCKETDHQHLVFRP